ncbi:MAG TPA: type II toxin-antitoxin system VapC family toxin [Vicinamibacterales bacterium]|nr:type II toxin-antitoxin system VapC family toxin [Vicinamibacterales bacterium]
MPGRPYLLDTNTLSDLIRRPQGRIADRLADVDEDRVVTSIVVACELRYGAAKRGSKRLSRQVEAVLDAIAVLPLEPGMDRHYAEIRAAHEKLGTPIGANDLLIAAHARTLRAVCVTANVTEFSRVQGLKVENWLD